ncbi:IspD/TarI family cytidylyltransferase [Campylobacter sp. LH-2024]|uniref:IspD/TarI family cytidylyltransferase n=1 Tax=Campylobacter sp. LH-2024 TaxID=3239825 RepID=UPI003B7930B6
MKNIVLIFAGGMGQRMGSSGALPKQFLLINNKPIIIHTLELFSQLKEIDSIVVVCLKEYIKVLEKYIKEYAVEKVATIVSGGTTGQESIFNGLLTIKKIEYCEDNNIIIHDGVRPLVSSKEILRSINCANLNGNAINISPMTETVLIKKENQSEIVDRNICYHIKAPQIFKFKDIFDFHIRAKNDCREFIDSASMASYYGKKLFFVECSNDNIKLTTPKDFYLMQALIQAKSVEDIFGI